MQSDIYLSEAQLEDLLNSLAKGGRWCCSLPKSSKTTYSETHLSLDFCPEIMVDYRLISICPVNCYPPPETIGQLDYSKLQVRIQFNNEQRRRILSKHGKKMT